MFEQIQGKFNRILKVLKGHGKIKESNIDDALREVRRALLEADVNYKVVQSFIERVKDKASGEKVYNSVSPGQQFIKILKDELTIFLGEKKEQISFTSKKPFVILKTPPYSDISCPIIMTLFFSCIIFFKVSDMLST